MHKYFIKTYGCQMNENDSEILAGILESHGYSETQDINSSDIILVNTCSIRDGAERKANGFIYTLSKLKDSKPCLLIGIIGCMAERLGGELLKKYKFIDFVLGPRKEEEFEEIIKNLSLRGVPSLSRDDEAICGLIKCKRLLRPDKIGARNDEIVSSAIHRPGVRCVKREKSVNAWITIMEGCDNFCSYCIVPYVRGREKSKRAEDILKEIEALDKDIFKEITLLGQNVNSYKFGFAELLNKVSRVDGIKRVRFMTSHPKDMTEDIMIAVKENPVICEGFHLPLQSGDDEVLKKMNRGYTREQYSALVKKIRGMIPTASITSDAIAGFPGETDEQFQNTLDLISELELDSVNTLAFDPRPGTPACNMEGKVPEQMIKKRLAKLMKVVEETSRNRNMKLVGSIQEILVEDPGFGRTRGGKIVRFEPKDTNTGDIVNVNITSANSWVLRGELNN